MPSRYEAIEVDGKWYVMDHRNPDKAPVERVDAEDAEISARFLSRFQQICEETL